MVYSILNYAFLKTKVIKEPGWSWLKLEYSQNLQSLLTYLWLLCAYVGCSIQQGAVVRATWIAPDRWWKQLTAAVPAGVAWWCSRHIIKAPWIAACWIEVGLYVQMSKDMHLLSNSVLLRMPSLSFHKLLQNSLDLSLLPERQLALWPIY